MDFLWRVRSWLGYGRRNDEKISIIVYRYNLSFKYKTLLLGVEDVAVHLISPRVN